MNKAISIFAAVATSATLPAAMIAAFAATTIAAVLPTGAMADTACTVTVAKFNQPYPYSGRATVEYTVGGTLPATAFAEITISNDNAIATFVQSNIVAGANSHVIDFASPFGGVLLLTNASFVVTINPGDDGLGGVQLWENGPYWAECNVGASEPEEYGSATTSGGATRWGIPEAEELGMNAPAAFTT